MPPHPSNVTYRAASYVDQDDVLALSEELWAYTESIDGRVRQSRPIEPLGSDFTELLESSSSEIWIAVTEHGMVGFCFVSFRQNNLHNDTKLGFINQLYVKGDWRRLGIGTQLCCLAEKWFATHNVKDIDVCGLIENSSALNFWEYLGFGTYLVRLRRSDSRTESRNP